MSEFLVAALTSPVFTDRFTKFNDSVGNRMNKLIEPTREIDVLRRSLEGLRSDLPTSWQWSVEEESPAKNGRNGRFDALVTIEAPDGQKAILVVEAKRLISSRDISFMVAQLKESMAKAGLTNAVPFLVARYLGPSTRERLKELGVSYADAAGNRQLALERPSLLIRNVGQDRDPWRGPGRPRGTLKGAPAARVVRWLADNTPPYTALQIVQGSGTSTGATYNVLRFLDEEELIERDSRGTISNVRWRQLLERGSRDFGFQQNQPAESVLFPRGVDGLVEALRAEEDLLYVVTGSIAAKQYEAYAPTRFAMLYADNVDEVIQRLDLRRVDAGANVLIAADRDQVAFVGARNFEGVRFAAPSQIVVDLMSGPGRSPSEGEALLDWMEKNERNWRS